MAAAKLIPMIEARVRLAWESFYAELVKMGGDARPKQAADIFVTQPNGNDIEVTVKPVSFRVKEKASHSSASIFVTVTGNILFADNSTRDDLRANGFATRVGYFREIADKKLKHVYGVHYDFDDERPAHPIFHCQISSMAAYVDHINSAHHRQFDAIGDGDDLVKGLLGNVRIPTAHMDPFSVFLQVIGDHLVSEVNDDGRVAFVRAQEAMSGIRSETAQTCRLSLALEQRCFRSGHWYRDAKYPVEAAS